MNDIELIKLTDEALHRLDGVPDWEKERCVGKCMSYLLNIEGRNDVRIWYLRSDFLTRWNYCKGLIVSGAEPFVDYDPNLCGVF